MSRCFPFPPPGYLRNRACGEDLIKSIKLQERDVTKEQRKKDKRERSEKRKERKERKEKEANAAVHSDGREKERKLKNVGPYQLKKIRTEQGSGCLLKADDENEQIERSGISEEHDQPFSSTEPCCLSDNTQTSNKRKRNMQPSSNDLGTAIKIRWPLRKHTDHDELQQDKGITEPTKESRPQSQGRRNSESEHKECQRLIRAGVDPNTNSIDSERGRMASLYNSLFQNWNACALQLKGFELEDRDWLSNSRRKG